MLVLLIASTLFVSSEEIQIGASACNCCRLRAGASSLAGPQKKVTSNMRAGRQIK
jgi:hypothetical protein